MPTILLCIADQHAGHKLGLLAPGVQLQDEGENGQIVTYSPQLGAFQEWLWYDVYTPGIDKAFSIAPGARVVVLNLGDPTHGHGHPEQTIGTRLSDQIHIAIANMQAVLSQPGVACVRFVAGTGVHEFGEGSATLLITSYLREHYRGIDIASLSHGLAEIDGVRIDYAHHGPGVGLRSWLAGNNVRYYLRDIMLSDMLAGRQAPDLVLRGHVHGYANEVVVVAGHEGRAVIVPSLCGLGDYARKVTRSQSALTVGMVAFVIDAGRIVDTVPLIESVDMRTSEVL